MRTELKQKIRKVRRKAFSLLLAVVLAATGIDLSLFTTTVIAADATSGSLGDNMRWSYSVSSDNARAVLHISGTGDTYSQSYQWYNPYYPKSIMDRVGIEIEIDEGVTDIGDLVLYKLKMREIQLPESVTRIGKYAFSQCEYLENVTIPKNVTSIGQFAFSGCKVLKSVEIPDSVTKLYGYFVFSDCTALESVTFPENIDLIGIESESMFSYCESLRSVTIPESVTVIAPTMFNHCTSLGSVTIPENVTAIMRSAFSGCTSLGSVTIPENVETIAGSAFSGCTALSEVIVKSEEPAQLSDKVFSNCKFVTDNTEGIAVPEAAVGDYLIAWEAWAPYIKKKELGAKQVIETFLKEYEAAKDTTEEQIKNAVEQKLAKVGITNATITIESFSKTDANISGTVKAVFPDEVGVEEISVRLPRRWKT